MSASVKPLLAENGRLRLGIIEQSMEATVSDDEERVECRNPVPGKAGIRIPRWKFDLLRALILEAFEASPAGVRFRDLPGFIRDRLSDQQKADLGSVSWHTTVVKLHLEAVDEIRRVEGSKPQVLRLV